MAGTAAEGAGVAHLCGSHWLAAVSRAARACGATLQGSWACEPSKVGGVTQLSARALEGSKQTRSSSVGC